MSIKISYKYIILEGDGVSTGIESFYRHLPVENMLCEVSLMRHEVRLAQVQCKTCGLKMARDVSDHIHAELQHRSNKKVSTQSEINKHEINKSIKDSDEHDIVPVTYVDWSLPPVGGVMDGVIQVCLSSYIFYKCQKTYFNRLFFYHLRELVHWLTRPSAQSPMH